MFSSLSRGQIVAARAAALKVPGGTAPLLPQYGLTRGQGDTRRRCLSRTASETSYGKEGAEDSAMDDVFFGRPLFDSGRSHRGIDRPGLLHRAPFGIEVRDPTPIYKDQDTLAESVHDALENANDISTLESALIEGDTRKIFGHIGSLVDPLHSPDGLVTTISSLPSTTFSELLRCLDISLVGEELDGGGHIPVRIGQALFTSMGRLVDKNGIKTVYTTLLRRLNLIARQRVEAGHRLSVSDYQVLMRSAGAASNIAAGKHFRHDMIFRSNYRDWEHSGVFNELIRTRFLTDPLYFQHDLSRIRVQPRLLHKSQTMLSEAEKRALNRLRTKIRQTRAHDFGHNNAELGYSREYYRQLMNPYPINALLTTALQRGQVTDEKVACSMLAALGYTGSVDAVIGMLKLIWGIAVTVNTKTGEVIVGQGSSYRLDHPMRPTDHLLDAVVHALCCQGEVAVALKVVDAISRQYDIKIPHKTWSTLLEWTYMASSSPIATEWKILGLHNRVLKVSAVHLIWDTMTSEPYSVTPDLKDFNIRVKALIRQGSRGLKDAMQLMRELVPQYEALVREQEDALFEYAQATRQGLDRTVPLARHRRAQSAKEFAWSCFNNWSLALVKRVRSNRLDDEMVVRMIPGLIQEFWWCMPPTIQYRTATGNVAIHTDNSTKRKAWAGRIRPRARIVLGPHPGRVSKGRFKGTWLARHSS